MRQFFQFFAVQQVFGVPVVIAPTCLPNPQPPQPYQMSPTDLGRRHQLQLQRLRCSSKETCLHCFNRMHKNKKQLCEAAQHLFNEDGEHGLPMNILHILHCLNHHSSLLTNNPAVANFLSMNKPSVPTFTAARNAAPLFMATISLLKSASP